MTSYARSGRVAPISTTEDAEHWNTGEAGTPPLLLLLVLAYVYGLIGHETATKKVGIS